MAIRRQPNEESGVVRRDVAIDDLIEAEGNGGGLALVGWGFAVVVALTP